MRLISKMIIRLQLFFSHLLKIEPTAKYKSRSLTLLAPFIPNPMGIQYILTIEKRNMHYYSGFYISLHQFAIDYTPLVAKYAVQQYVTMYEEAANTQVIVQFSVRVLFALQNFSHSHQLSTRLRLKCAAESYTDKRDDKTHWIL